MFKKLLRSFQIVEKMEKKEQSKSNFTLRPWSLDDLDSLVHFANNAKIASNLTDRFPYPYTVENGKWFIGMATSNTPIHVFAIDQDGLAIGAIGLHDVEGDAIYSKNKELGYWLAEPYWGQGIITEAVQQMVRYGFQHWDINRIFARPFGRNVASKRVLEKAGFTLEARIDQILFKNGVYEDELIYGIRRSR
ncbi:MAG: hypothetical protein RLZZ292_1782 [Bacteroidota bacterium]